MPPLRLILILILAALSLLLQRALDGYLSLERFSHEEAISKLDCFHCHHPPRAGYHAGWVRSCSKCHEPSAWKPANFEHRYFPLQGDHKTECSVCHPTTAAAYTCEGCHGAEEMRAKHSKLKIDEMSLKDCIICHPEGKVVREE